MKIKKINIFTNEISERELTAEEIAEHKAEAERLAEELKNAPPTETERLEAIEMAILELAEVLCNG